MPQAQTFTDVKPIAQTFSDVQPIEAPQRRGVMDSATDFASEFWNQVNPIAGIKGAAQLTAHPIESFKSDAGARQKVYEEAESEFKKGNHVAGAAKLLYSFIPMVGPQLNEAAHKFTQGQYAKGAGQSVGLGVAMATPQIVEGIRQMQPIRSMVPEGVPERLYKSALKPSTTIPTPKVEAMVQTGLKNAIPVSASGIEKLGALVDDLNSKIKDVVDHGSNQGATISKYKVASRLSDLSGKFSNQVNPLADLNAIGESGNEFLSTQLKDIPSSDAQALKQGTYRQLKSRAYGELKSAAVESQKALARGIKEELVNQFPELEGWNAEESKLLQLDPVLERAVNRISNHQIIGIGTPIAAGAAKAVTGSTGIGAVTGLLKAVFDDPLIKSKIAIALAKKGVPPQGVTSRMASYAAALGNAAKGEAGDSQGAAQ